MHFTLPNEEGRHGICKRIPYFALFILANHYCDRSVDGPQVIFGAIISSDQSAIYLSDFGIPSAALPDTGAEVLQPPLPRSFTQRAMRNFDAPHLASRSRRLGFIDRRIPFSQIPHQRLGTLPPIIHQDCIIRFLVSLDPPTILSFCGAYVILGV